MILLFFRDPANLFLHGIIEGKGGTCSNMPTLVVAIGRRLGYPLKLVRSKRHEFVRWEDSDGQRFNIEATSRGFVSHPDEYYLSWPLPTTLDEVKRYGFLEALTVEDEIEGAISRRGRVLAENGQYREAAFIYVNAFCHAPREHVLIFLHHALAPWRQQLIKRIGLGFPCIQLREIRRLHPKMPLHLVEEVHYLNALQLMLDDPIRDVLWWEPLRRNPQFPPPDVPKMIRVTYPSAHQGQVKFEAVESFS